MPSRIRIFLLISTALLAQASWSYGLHSGISGLSPQFLQDYEAAYKATHESKSTQPFIDLLGKYEAGNERTELEVTLGMIYNQASGFVDPSKAVEHFTDALRRDLPEQTRSKILLLRGGSREQLKKLSEARDDYFRALLECSYRDFSGGWPQTAEPNVNFAVNSQVQENIDASLDYLRYRKSIADQEFLLQQRYYLIDAIRRVTKMNPLSEEKITEILKRLSPDSSRYEIIQKWLRSDNPRPWP